MSLLMGKSNRSCSVESEESSNSVELDESDPAITSSAYDLQLLHSIFSFGWLAVVKNPAKLGPISAVIAETDPHLVDEDACETGLWHAVLSALLNFRNDSPTSEFHMRRKKSESVFPGFGGVKSKDSFERRASASSLALSHCAIWRVAGHAGPFMAGPQEVKGS